MDELEVKLNMYDHHCLLAPFESFYKTATWWAEPVGFCLLPDLRLRLLQRVQRSGAGSGFQLEVKLGGFRPARSINKSST